MHALLSVSDKTGIVPLAQTLSAKGYSLLSTGGTASLLRDEGIAITEVSEHTGFPEIMAGRVKTLHPAVHGGILGRRGVDDAVMQEHGIDAIDLVVVNLYPFEQATSAPDCTFDDAVENIDIGGPAMVRAAAKNHASVTVVTDPADYQRISEALESADGIDFDLRFDLAVKAFEHTSRYDGMIASYFGRSLAGSYPRTINQQYQKVSDLRYGENPHQSAAFYREPGAGTGTVSSARQIQGRELSYNNIADTDAALECVKQYESPACVIVKHANPCGVAVRDALLDAYHAAYRTDPTSAFGGIIAFNQSLDAATAKAILERQFVEVIVAPGIDADASPVLATKPNIRVLNCGAFESKPDNGLHYARVNGGLLVQQRDTLDLLPQGLTVVTEKRPDNDILRDLRFAWTVAKFVKSNAIVYCSDSATIGVGAGQMSRVYSAKIAGIKAADESLDVQGAVMASDAFFPFRDGIDAAAEAGIRAVIQPGGSKNDEEVIAAANEHGLVMVFTGIRHFRH